MTATLTAVPTAPARPVPWHRLAWVAWRRYRTTLLALSALLIALAVFLVARGLQIRDAYAAVQACTPQPSARCGFAFTTFREAYTDSGPLAALFIWMPAVIGAFAGAPLLARELETDTFRFAWTQGAGRTRWMVSHTAVGAIVVVGLAAAFDLLMSWYMQPLIDSGLQQRMHASAFPVTGAAAIGWALAAFALGVLLGLVTHRVIASLAATLVAWTGLAFLASTLRLRYVAPLVTSDPSGGSARDLQVDQWWVHGGTRVTSATLDQVLASAGVQPIDAGNAIAGPGQASVDPVQYLMAHGYTILTSYQPDSRYWHFQWIEFAWLSALSLVLLAASVVLLRRRPA